MAKIKTKSATIKKGITGAPEGSIQILQFPRPGVITGSSEPIRIKRPNQYKSKSESKPRKPKNPK